MDINGIIQEAIAEGYDPDEAAEYIKFVYPRVEKIDGLLRELLTVMDKLPLDYMMARMFSYL